MKNILFIFSCLIFSAHSFGINSDTSVSALIKKAEKTNLAKDWNKVIRYYCKRLDVDGKESENATLVYRYSERTIKSALAEEDSLELGNLNTYLAEVEFITTGWEGYVEHYEKALNFFYAADDMNRTAAAIMKLGEGYLALELYEQAEECFSTILDAPESYRETIGHARVCLNMSRALGGQNKQDSAWYYVEMAIDLGMKNISDHNDLLAEAHIYKGYLYSLKGDYIMPVHHYNMSLQICDFTKNNLIRSSAFHHIALLYADARRYELAVGYFEKAVNALGDGWRANYYLANIHGDYAMLLSRAAMDTEEEGILSAGANTLAHWTSHMAIIRGTFILDNWKLYTNYIQTAMICNDYNEPDSCMYYLELAQGLIDKNLRLPDICYRKVMGEALMKKGMYDDAISYLEDAVNAKNNYHRRLIFELKDYEIYNYLSVCYAHRRPGGGVGQDMAFLYMSKAYAEREKHFDDEHERTMASFYVEKETFEKEVKIEDMEHSLRRILGISGLLVLIILVGLFAWRQYSRRIKLEKRQMKLDSELKEAQRFRDGTEAERERLAKELHDHVSNELFAVTRFELKDSGVSTDTLNHLEEIADHVRELSHELSAPFGSLLRNLSSRVQYWERTGIHFDISVNDDNRFELLPKEYSLNIYRIMQEAVGNIIKHANARNVWISLDSEGETLVLKVLDDGHGFDTAQVSMGKGLENIRQRCMSLQAELEIKSLPGEGSLITVIMDCV